MWKTYQQSGTETNVMQETLEDMDENEWHEWRGSIDARMKVNDSTLEEIDGRMARIEDKVADLLGKISVPLFVMQIFGTGVGAVLVWLLTKGLK
jgi:hypothetical protein